MIENEEKQNPFGRGQMPLGSKSRIKRAANQFLVLEEECIISPDRVVVAQCDSYQLETFGRAWGMVFVYESGNLCEYGYLSYDGILGVRDIGSKVYEVRYNEQETAWDDEYCDKYECYAKRVKGDLVTLAKWGDCEPRQLNLTLQEYGELCSIIERMPNEYPHFPDYKTRIRPRRRGEHRYLIEEHLTTSKKPKRDKYGRRYYGRRAVVPFDHGNGKLAEGCFIVGTADVWTATTSGMRWMFSRLEENSIYGKPQWDEADVIFTYYKEGLFTERCRFHVYQLLEAVAHQTEKSGDLLIGARDERFDPVRLVWDQQGATLYPLYEDEEDTRSIWIRRDVWEWVLEQVDEFEGWYEATKEEMDEIAKK